MSLQRMDHGVGSTGGSRGQRRGGHHTEEQVQYTEPDFDMTYENLVNLSPVRCGLDSDTLASLPRMLVADATSLPEERCSVCLCDYEGEDEILTLPCRHVFHEDCIGSWLQESKVCPCCKQEICAV